MRLASSEQLSVDTSPNQAPKRKMKNEKSTSKIIVDDDFEEIESEDFSSKINEVKLESKSEESINKLQQFSFKKQKHKK